MTSKVYCFGAKYEGQASDPTFADVALPRDVGVSGATAIAAGGSQSCAITGATIQCWGGALLGQLGNGTIGVYPMAQPMVDLALP